MFRFNTNLSFKNDPTIKLLKCTYDLEIINII